MLKNDFGPKEDPMLGSIVILLIPSKKNSASYNFYFKQLIDISILKNNFLTSLGLL